MDSDTKREGRGSSLRLIFSFLYRYARRYWLQYSFGFLALFATNWAVVRISTLIGDILNTLEDSGVGTASFTAESAAAALGPASAQSFQLMGLAVALIVARPFSRVLFFNPGRDIQYRLGVDLFTHLLTLQRPFYAQRKIGELVSIAANDTQSVRLLVGFAGLQVCNVAVAIPLHLYEMLRTDWVLTLWCVAPVALGAIYMRFTIQRFYTKIRASLEQLASLSERILESFSGVGTIRAHVAEEAAVARFEQYNRDYFDLQLEIASLRAFAMPALTFSGYVGACLVLWVGGNRVLDHQLQVGSLATFTALLLTLVSILTSLAWVLTAISRGTVALSRVHGLLDADPALPEPKQRDALRAPPRVELRGLSFTHAGREQPAIAELDVTIEPSATLGIFGRTGAGKTTLIDLLARVYTPDPGMVLINGQDARELELGALREGMAVVPQTPFLFSTTLRDNIRLRGERTGHTSTKADAAVAGPRLFGLRLGGRQVEPPPALEVSGTDNDSALEGVIQAACLIPDIAALAEGLDTVVGERGVMLSGGQRQRTALARALYRRPKLLLLDDVLSAVDQATEAKLVAAIRGLSSTEAGAPPTTVVVSHRTSVLEHADEILVLDEGRVVERGTHAELIALGGAYAAAHQHQREEGAEPDREGSDG